MSDIVDTLGRPMFGRKCTDSATTRDDLLDASNIIGALTAKLERANERIRRLEEAGNALVNVLRHTEGQDYCDWIDNAHDAEQGWRDAKEAKP